METNEVNETNKVRYFYLRTANRQPVGCVAFTKKRNESKVSYNLSVVHSSDEFLKDRGRTIATSRLLKSPMTLILDSPDQGGLETLKVLVQSLSTNKNMPSKVRKAALLWLSTPHQKPQS